MKNTMMFVLAGTFLTFSACTKGLKGVEVKTESEKNLYALGTKFGNSLQNLNLTEDEALIMARGFYEASLNQKLEGTDDPERAQKVQDYLSSRKDKSKVDIQKQGQNYLENFVKNGGQKTKSGLAFLIIKEGEGKSPGPKDTVDIHYQASLTDGTVFGSTLGPNQPARYPLDRIIPGWAEGIQLISPGGKIKLVIPPELAYGDTGAAPKVPPGATLVFEIDLLTVTQAKASK